VSSEYIPRVLIDTRVWRFLASSNDAISPKSHLAPILAPQ